MFAKNCKDYLHFLEPQFFALAFAVVFEDLVAFVEQFFELQSFADAVFVSVVFERLINISFFSLYYYCLLISTKYTKL